MMRSLRSRFTNGRSGRLRSLVEPLEERLCLSVTVASVATRGGTELRINSNNESDTINIVSQANGTVDVTDAAGNSLGSAQNVSSIRVKAGGGDDVVNYTLAEALTRSQSLSFQLGQGNDQANFDLAAGIGAGASLSISVDGESGDDAIASTLGNVAANARFNFKAEGSSGADTLSLEGLETTIDALASVQVQLSGGKGVDTLNTTLNGTLLGRVSVDANGGKDNDTVATNIHAGPGSTGQITANVAGDQGDDNLTLNVLDHSAEEGAQTTLARVRATINDCQGHNTITSTQNVQVPGNRSFRHLGGNGNNNGGFAFGRRR